MAAVEGWSGQGVRLVWEAHERRAPLAMSTAQV